MTEHRGTRSAIFAITLAGTSALASTAAAVEPPVNTGATSFMDGFSDPRGAGFSYNQYARFSSAGAVKDVNGNDVPFKNPRLNVFADLNQFIYSFKTPDGSIGHPGLYTIVPLVECSVSGSDPGGAPLQDNGFGLGDMILGGFFQFSTIVSNGRPVFAHRADMAVQAPTGKYDPTKISPGSNTWALNPSWAATLMPVDRLELSTRINYLFNFQNNNVAVPGGGTTNAQEGQAIFDNFALAYEVLPFNPERTAAYSLRAGLNGYYFKQITENTTNGQKMTGSLEQVLGLGPGVMWIPTKDDAFWFNVYFETAVENRFAANVFQARWARTF